jgi:hypothetical protein
MCRRSGDISSGNRRGGLHGEIDRKKEKEIAPIAGEPWRYDNRRAAFARIDLTYRPASNRSGCQPFGSDKWCTARLVYEPWQVSH